MLDISGGAKMKKIKSLHSTHLAERNKHINNHNIRQSVIHRSSREIPAILQV